VRYQPSENTVQKNIFLGVHNVKRLAGGFPECELPLEEQPER